MAYLVLARRARPQTFAEVVGQRVVVRTLQNALASNRVPHALMFSGVRGVGKTTLARIMAKALNCVHGPTPVPCNQCASCREISSGASLDLHEIDGASNRGIQEIRELKEGLRFMPASSRYKVVIIDEVHMLTSEAFNALLKTLEEPPGHVYFVLATTEPHKVPVTIQSRCQRYELKRVARQELAEHFSRLLTAEAVTVEHQALDLIVRESEGSVRDGLSLLDQVLSYVDGDTIRLQDVIDVLGVMDRELVVGLLQAVLAGDLATCLDLLDQVFVQGLDFKHFVNALLDGCRALVLCRASKDPARLLDLPEQELERYASLGEGYSVETLLALFNQLFEGCERAARSVRPRLALELAMIRAVQAGSIVPVGEILARLDALLGGESSGGIAVPVAQQPVEAPRMPPGEHVRQDSGAAGSPQSPLAAIAAVPAAVKDVPVVTGSRPGSAAENESAEKPAVPATPLQVATENPMTSVEKEKLTRNATDDLLSEKKVRQRWDEFVDYMKKRKVWMAHTLRRCDSVSLKDGRLIIRFQLGADCVLFQERQHLQVLTECAVDFFQANLQIVFEAMDGISCNIAGENGSGPRQQRHKLANDPLVQLAGEIFQGRIGDIRVGSNFRGHFPDVPGEVPEGSEEGGQE